MLKIYRYATVHYMERSIKLKILSQSIKTVTKATKTLMSLNDRKWTKQLEELGTSNDPT